MSMKRINIFCFIILLVSTTFFSVATAVDGYIFESNAGTFHKLLLTNDTTETNEFSFTFSKDSNCLTKRLKISFGSAKSGSSLISFNFDIFDMPEEGVVAKVISMDDLSTISVIGDKFVANFKSLGPIKLQAIGKLLKSSSTNIREEFSFDKFNSTHLGITFYARFTDANTQECSIMFDFPDYDVLEGKTILPPNTSPSQKPTPQPLETTNTGVPEISTSTSEKTNTPSENIIISQTVFYIIIGVSTLVLMIIISAVTLYLVVSKFSNPTELSEKPLKGASNTNSSNISISTFLYTFLITLALNLILHGYGVYLFLYFPFINDYSQISNRQSFKIHARDNVQVTTNSDEGNQNVKMNNSISTQPEQSAKKK